jgi:ectoine hydroxylase-related dioxygenase (phytanoyl-CoA dioxygenase family)
MKDLYRIKEEFLAHGFTVVENAIRLGELEPLKSLIEKEINDRAQAFYSTRELDELFESEPLQLRLLRLGERCPRLRQGWKPNLNLSREIYELMTHDSVKEILMTILSAEAFTDASPQLRIQNPSSTQETTAWHQDTSYANDALKKEGVVADKIQFVTCWIPLMDVDVQNGCLNVMPGSKNWGLVKSSRDAENHIRAQIDVEARGCPVPVPMKQGDILFMHNLCLHCGNLNVSDRLRWSVDFRYFPAADSERLDAEQKRILDVMSHLGEKDRRPTFRGVSRSGRQSSYEEWIDRSRSLEASDS